MTRHKDQEEFTALDYYVWIIRNMGVPSRFYWDANANEWVAEAPFTKLDDEALNRVLSEEKAS